MQKEINNRKYKKITIGLIVTICVLSAAIITLSILWIIQINKSASMQNTIEMTYQKNFNELVDNVNNTEVKLSKVVASNYDSYTKKLFQELEKNTCSASNNMSSLPISINGMSDSIKFVNQVSGYCSALAEKLDKGEEISQTEKDTLKKLLSAIKELKINLNDISYKVSNSSIFNNSISMNNDLNEFTVTLSAIKNVDTEFPTMIYDGPFSESQLSPKIKNVSATSCTQEQAKNEILKIFSNISENKLESTGETKGKFETFDFKAINSDNITMYLQVCKNGCHLLTVSSYNDNSVENISMEKAISLAKDFAKMSGIDNLDCVWNDKVGGNAYINLAPIQNGIILYPDIVKVKIDLTTGNLLGFEASAYYTNHTNRNLVSALINGLSANKQIPDGYNIVHTKLALAPLDFGREVLCHEIKCTYDGSTYYFYINAQTGICENILKVMETDNGNLLM